MFTKRFWQLASGFAGLVIVGLLVFWASTIVVEQNNPEYKAQKDQLKQLERLEKLYREDPYGGDTPEETLELFISALKAGDIDLASKYFLPDEWEKWRKNLQRVKDNGNLEEMITDLSGAKLANTDLKDSVLFSIADEHNRSVADIRIGKNINNKWKILDL